ncbi:hypothetical protein EST55_03015 [Idiomarina sp. 29L]|uniref:hypothetical protein n=1 Tax=Idiomarina sp. 29L TaxID=2508877 RepID=UPI00101263AD|nr:hypothetical protein [Idiomarina sp. 29L]RXS44461.1 hypothetical protein EST55_03015 [Idiomarina sp. 29L]
MSKSVRIDIDSVRELAARTVPFFKYTSILVTELDDGDYVLGKSVDVELFLPDIAASPFHFSAQVSWLFDDKSFPYVISLLPQDIATGHRLSYLTNQYKAEYGKLFDSLINSCAT